MTLPSEHAESAFPLHRRLLLLGSIAAGGSGLMAALGASGARAGTTTGGTLRFGIGDSFAGETLDPSRGVNGGSLELFPVIEAKTGSTIRGSPNPMSSTRWNRSGPSASARA
jgi:hypothetical protein